MDNCLESDDVRQSLASLLSNLPGIAYRCRADQERSMDFISDGVFELTGYRPSQLLENSGPSFAQLIHPQDRPRVLREISQALAKKEHFILTYRLLSAAQEIKWVWDKGQGVFGENGGLAAVEGFISDITERRQMEDAVKESEERYRTLVEMMQEGIFTLNIKAELTYCNHQLCKMIGHSRLDLVGTALISYIHADSQDFFHKQMEREAEGRIEKYELVLMHADGHKVFTLITPTPIFDDEGDFQGTFGVITDITPLKIMENQLLQAQKLESIGQLAAGIAHEINTPTQYVDNNVRYLDSCFKDMQKALDACLGLAGELAGDPAQAGTAEKIKQAFEGIGLEILRSEVPEAISDSLTGLGRIAEIVRSIKQLSHPGQREKIPADLNEAVRSTVVVSTNEWKYVADLTSELDPELPFVPCLIGEFNQVLLNLIINAAHAIKEKIGESPQKKGRIEVKTRQNGEFVEVSVSDSGAGIPESIREKIFDPFFTTKPVGKGTGQGLAICHGIVVEMHGGKISFESELGQGTTFTVSLPLEPTSHLRS